MRHTARLALGAWALAGLCLALSGTPALAAPGPLLGPDGPLWIGPLTPATPVVISQGRGLALVDPRNGGLWIEVTDASLGGPGPEAAVRRVYREGRWRWTTEERLVEDPRGLRIGRLAGDLDLAADAPRSDELVAWPVDTRITAHGVEALRTREGWRVDDGTLTTLYGDDGWPLWREDARRNRVSWERELGLLTGILRTGGPRLSIQVDGQGRPSVVRGPDGLAVYLEHDADRLVRTGPLQQETRYVYDAAGRLTTITWADLSQLKVAWTSTDQVKSLSGPGPRRTSCSWSADGLETRSRAGAPTRLTWTTEGYTLRDPAGAEVRVTLDQGRLAGWTDPAGVEVRLSRTETGQVSAVEGATAWRLGWRDGRLVDLVDPAGASWRIERTTAGDVKRLVDPDGRSLNLQRHADGTLRSVDPGTAPLRLELDPQGRPRSIQAPNGSTTKLSWTGDSVEVADPSEQTVRVEGLRSSRTVLTNRLGEKWSVWRDVMGRPERLGLPDGRIVEVQRNSLGRVGALVARQGPEVRYGWRSDGRPTRVTDTLGAATSLAYDLSGRLSGMTRTDGSRLIATRDARGELTGVTLGIQSWEIGRDRAGLPTALGPLTWAWDIAGRWLGWVARGVEVALERTGAGRVRRVSLSDGTRYGIDTDPAGRVSRVRTAQGTWALERDPDGGVNKLSGPGALPVSVSRDDRGLVTLITWGPTQRRVLRDAAGTPVKWTASSGATLSVNSAGQGRTGLGRLPSGALAQWRHTAGESVLELLDPGGRLLLSRALRIDPRGRTARVDEGAASTVWRWDPLGEQVAVETSEGAWSWLPGRLEGPGGHVVLFDKDGRPAVAVPPVGTDAWGMPGDRLDYLLDDAGRVVGVSGDAEQLVEVEHDPLGRLTALVVEDGRRWTLSWDPFGRLSSLVDPDGVRTRLGHGVGSLLGWERPGHQTELLAAPGLGWIEVTGDTVQEVLTDETGSPRIVLAPDQDPRVLTWGATGMPDQVPGTALGWHGAWAVLPGGPLIDGGGTFDPVTGTRTDPGWQVPWWTQDAALGAWPVVDGASSPWWDPEPWTPRTAWADPMALLVALGELPSLVPAEILGLPDRTPPLAWLPQAAGQPALPLSGGGLATSSTDRLVALALRVSVAPTVPVTTRDVLDAILMPEFEDLPALDGLVADPGSWWQAGLQDWLSAE